MKEQEQRSLEELHKAHNRVNRALTKVDTNTQTIGSPAFVGLSKLGERLDLSKLQGEPFLDAAVKVGRIKMALQENAKPKLLFQKEKVEREIVNFDRIQKVQVQLKQISQFVEKGLLSKQVLEDAQRALADISLGIVPPPPPEAIIRKITPVEEPPKVEEGKRFVLPDGKVINNLSPLESVIVAKLLESSKENPLASSELVQSVYEDRVSVDVGRKRLSPLLSSIRGKLAEAGWRVNNNTFKPVKGKEGLYYLAKEELEPKMFRLPDGKLVKVTEMQMRYLSFIPLEEDVAMPSSELVKKLYADEFERGEIELLVAFKRAKTFRYGLNANILDPVGWKIKNAQPIGRKKGEIGTAEAKLYLAPIQEEKQPERSGEPRKLVLPDGQVIDSLSHQESVILAKLLGYSEENPISLSELVPSVYGDRVSVEVGRKRLFFFLTSIRRKLADIGWKVNNSTLNTGRGKEGLYYLVKEETQDVVEEKLIVKVKPGEMRGKTEVALPDGKRLNLAPKQKIVVEGLLYGSKEHPVRSSELAELVYGEEVPKEVAIKRLSVTMGEVKKKLDSAGWDIVNLTLAIDISVGREALYYLAQKEVKDVVEEKPTDGQEKVTTTIKFVGTPSTKEPEGVTIPEPSETPSPAPVEEKKLEEEVTIIPYTPTEKERRTQEETQILDVIVSSLLNETRMRFDQVQAQLFSGDRTKPLVGGQAVFIYQVDELIQHFNSAAMKFREEAEIPALRENWAEEEKEMWSKLETLRTKFQVTEARDFLRRISEEIRRSERQFYRDYPPESGNRVTWIRKDHNR